MIYVCVFLLLQKTKSPAAIVSVPGNPADTADEKDEEEEAENEKNERWGGLA